MGPVYNDELYHYGKLGMKWGHRKAQSGIAGGSKKKSDTTSKIAKKTKKSIKDHHATGAKAVGKTLKFLGQNAMRAHELYDADRISKMVFPD